MFSCYRFPFSILFILCLWLQYQPFIDRHLLLDRVTQFSDKRLESNALAVDFESSSRAGVAKRGALHGWRWRI